MKTNLRTLLALSTGILVLPAAAWAQSGGAGQGQSAGNLPLAAANLSPGSAQDQSGTTVGEVIVTATRRATTEQKVPATIDVATAATLETNNITDAQGLQQLVPGVTVSVSGGITPFIRGIGTFNAGFSEASVGYYIDGVYLPNSAGVLASFNNVDRVEVLKGPQGTLYGRNTTGGLINVITRAPSDQPTLDAALGYGNFDDVTEKLYVSGPVAPNFDASLALYNEKQARGWSTNLFNGDSVQKSQDTGVYGKLQWTPTAQTKITFSQLYDYSNQSKGFAFAIAPGTFGTDGSPYVGQWKIDSRLDPSSVYHENLSSLRIDQDLGFAKFFSLTAYQRSGQVDHTNSNADVGTTLPGQSASNTYINFNSTTWSEELQLSSSSSGSPFEWILGGFYYNDVSKVQTALYTTCIGAVCSPLAGNAPPQLVSVKPTTLSYSGYADGTYNFTSSTHVTIGLRYTDETKGFSGLVTPFPGQPNSAATLPASIKTTPAQFGVPPSIHADKLTYRAVLEQDFGNNIHGYASINTGFKSGTYNPNSIAQNPVRPEEVTAYEVGVKSELFERRVRLNLAVFDTSWKDIQVRSNAGLPVGSASIQQNIAAATLKGVDGQMDWRATSDLSFTGGFEYLDATYDNYPGGSCTVPRIPSGAILGGLIATTCNLAGYTLPISPKWSADLGATYTFHSRYGLVVLTANDSYRSRYSFVTDDSLTQGPHHIIDAALIWKAPSHRYDVQLYVKNLTNEYTFQAGQNGSTYVYVPGEPRTFGIMVGYHF